MVNNYNLFYTQKYFHTFGCIFCYKNLMSYFGKNGNGISSNDITCNGFQIITNKNTYKFHVFHQANIFHYSRIRRINKVVKEVNKIVYRIKQKHNI